MSCPRSNRHLWKSTKSSSCPELPEHTSPIPPVIRENGWVVFIEGSLETKLPTTLTDEKQRWEESEKRREETRREEKRREKRRKEKKREEKRREEEKKKEERRPKRSRKKEDPGARKGRKVAKHSVFPMICGSGGSKSRLAQVAGAQQCGQMRDEKLHAAVVRTSKNGPNM